MNSIYGLSGNGNRVTKSSRLMGQSNMPKLTMKTVRHGKDVEKLRFYQAGKPRNKRRKINLQCNGDVF